MDKCDIIKVILCYCGKENIESWINGGVVMDAIKAEDYLSNRLLMLSDEKILIATKLNKTKLEIVEIENKIKSMEGEVDKAFEVFSPRPKKNDFVKIEIEKLEKHKDELLLMCSGLEEQCTEIEKEINILKEALEESTDCAEENHTFDRMTNGCSKMYGLNILESQEEERKRIARELHDSIVQVLTNLVHKCEICMKIIDVDPIRAKLELEIMAKTIRDSIGEMRNIIYDLRPMSFDDLGLDITLERAVKSIDSNTDMNVSLKFDGEKVDLPPIVQLTIFRIVQECANNSIKYSQGKNLNIKVVYENDSVVLEISDDGIGFDYIENQNSDNEEHTGFGINMMRERVSLLSGFIDIETAIGEGTITRVNIPI